MSVIGHLRRSALGAGGVALLLPLGLALGVAVTAALGGEDRLRALGQVVGGPAAPARAKAPGLESVRKVPRVPVRRRPTATVGPSSVPQGDASPPTAGVRPVQPEPDPARPGPDPRPDPEPQAPSASTTPTTPAEPAEPAQPAPPVEAPPGPLDDAVGQGPAAGPLTDGAMQTVVDLIP